MNKVLVIGAQNADIFAKPHTNIVLGDSNPSQIEISYGGVGRNMAVNLCRLGHHVSFISVFGDDILSLSVKNDLEQIGVHLDHSLKVNESKSSIYIGVLNQDNDLYTGYHDMDLINHLTPDFLKSKSSFLETYEYIVLDNNISESSLEYLLKTYSERTIIIDAVSAHKASKLKNHLNKISILKLNQLELNALSELSSSKEQLEDLLEKGAKSVLLTQKEEHSILSIQNKLYTQKPQKIKSIVNATGAGDAFLSGYIHGILSGKTEEVRLKMANFAAGITLASNEATSPELCSKKLEKAIHE